MFSTAADPGRAVAHARHEHAAPPLRRSGASTASIRAPWSRQPRAVGGRSRERGSCPSAFEALIRYAGDCGDVVRRHAPRALRRPPHLTAGVLRRSCWREAALSRAQRAGAAGARARSSRRRCLSAPCGGRIRRCFVAMALEGALAGPPPTPTACRRACHLRAEQGAEDLGDQHAGIALDVPRPGAAGRALVAARPVRASSAIRTTSRCSARLSASR